MDNQELSALIADEVKKAVAPLYEQLEQIKKGNIPPKEEEPEEKEETPDFTSTAKRLRAMGLIK